MWFTKIPKKTFVTTSDNSIGFFKEDYLCHYISGTCCWFLTIQFKCNPYIITADYRSKEERDIALKSLNEIIK